MSLYQFLSERRRKEEGTRERAFLSEAISLDASSRAKSLLSRPLHERHEKITYATVVKKKKKSR